MEPPFARFFRLPELFCHLCSFLSPHDIARVIRTNKELYALTSQLFWSDVDLEANHRVELFYTSPGAMQTFAQFTPDIRKLKAGFAFMTYYFECMLAFLSSVDFLLDGQRVELPPWVPHNLVLDSPTPLPLITQLNQLDVSLPLGSQPNGFLFAALGEAPTLPRRLSWFMALNARTLIRVSLRNVRIPYPIEIRCLCRAIASLERLTHLNINIPATDISTKPAFSIVLLIFFSCPTSLVSFKLTAITRPNREGEDDEYFQEPRTNDPDLTEGPIARRAEPLRNLKSLTLPIYEGSSSVSGYGARDLQDILSHCPALENWDVPCLRDADTRGVITAFLRQRPILDQPSLPVTLRTLTSEFPGKDRKGLTMAEIMDLIPGNQLKSLSFQHYEDIPTNTAWPGSGRFLSALLRHSRSLVSISLLNMDQIQSNTIKAIVTNCEALEALVLSCSNAMSSRLKLEDATDQPWSCLRLKQLSLAVDLRRGCKDQDHMLHLFYHQLGKLTSLEELELISACRKSLNATAQYWETTMTSMLSLGNAHVTPSKRGFLSFLVCLSRLRVLLGSFNIVQKEMREMFGEAEAAWVLQHWPRLEIIELFTSTERLTRRLEFPQVGLLLEHRPSLRLYR